MTPNLEYFDTCSGWRPHWQNRNLDCGVKDFLWEIGGIKKILVGDVPILV